MATTPTAPPLSDDDLAHMEMRHAAASPLPWSVVECLEPWGSRWELRAADGSLVLSCNYISHEGGGEPPQPHDLEALLSALADRPRLLAEVRRFRDALKIVREAAEKRLADVSAMPPDSAYPSREEVMAGALTFILGHADDALRGVRGNPLDIEDHAHKERP